MLRHFNKMGATNEPIGIYASTAPTDGVEQLRKIVMDERPALFIVDPTIRLARILDSNDYAKVSAALEPFLAVARKSGTHICLVHHAGRANGSGVDAPTGSTAFAGVPDTILVMKRKGTMRTLSSTQRYGTDLEEVVLEVDEAGWINAAGTKQE